jgi:hypothetical protein
MRPTLVVNPHDDEVFVAYAELLLDHGVVSAAELERRLRTVYPRTAVHERELSGEPVPVWYVYRDGRWARSQSDARSGVNRANA